MYRIVYICVDLHRESEWVRFSLTACDKTRKRILNNILNIVLCASVLAAHRGTPSLRLKQNSNHTWGSTWGITDLCVLNVRHPKYVTQNVFIDSVSRIHNISVINAIDKTTYWLQYWQWASIIFRLSMVSITPRIDFNIVNERASPQSLSTIFSHICGVTRSSYNILLEHDSGSLIREFRDMEQEVDNVNSIGHSSSPTHKNDAITLDRYRMFFSPRLGNTTSPN